MKSKFITAMDLLHKQAELGDLSLGQIISILGDECHPILLLFLSLPYLIPVSIPGMSTPSGVLICMVAVMQFLNKPPWIPLRFKSKMISAKTLVHISEAGEKAWIKLAPMIHERWLIFYDIKIFKFINFLVLIINAILLSLPLPIPLTNTLPGIAIILCSLGYTEKDGLFIFLSYLWSLLVLSFFISIAMGANHFIGST